jgi:hypothetical protein
VEFQALLFDIFLLLPRLLFYSLAELLEVCIKNVKTLKNLGIMKKKCKKKLTLSTAIAPTESS